MEKTIFKVGDGVYYYSPNRGCLSGIISNIFENETFCIEVQFEYKEGKQRFTKDGRLLANDLPTLSFAPYDFVNGGFTQKRPLPEIEVDTLVYVKLYYGDTWVMAYFSDFEDDYMFVFKEQLKSNQTIEVLKVKEWSLTNPLEK